MKALKESSSRLCPPGDVSLSAARWGVSGVVSRASDFTRPPDGPRGGAFPGALASMSCAGVAKRAASARPAGCAPWAVGGGRPAACSASGTGISGRVQGWPAFGALLLPLAVISGGLVRSFSGWSAPPLGISLWGGPRAGSSAAGDGASVRLKGPPISSLASTVGSSRCGWAGGAGGVAAPAPRCAPSRVWPSCTGVAPGWPPGWADRGLSAGTVARVGSGSGSEPGLGAG